MNNFNTIIDTLGPRRKTNFVGTFLFAVSGNFFRITSTKSQVNHEVISREDFQKTETDLGYHFIRSSDSGRGHNQSLGMGGIIVVQGPSGSGKSPLARDLGTALDKKVNIIRYGEPFDGYTLSDKGMWLEVLGSIARGEVFVLDSLKDITASGGALLPGGVSRDLFLTISKLSVLCATTKSVGIVVLNTGIVSADHQDQIRELAISSASGLLYKSKPTDASWRFIIRPQEYAPRIEGVLNTRSSSSQEESVMSSSALDFTGSDPWTTIPRDLGL